MSEVVINVTKVEEVVTINATPNVTQILVNTNNTIPQNLNDVLTEGNATDGENIFISDGDEITFDNGSRIRKGLTDAGNGGAKGVALVCSLDYELKWEAGRQYIMQQDGFTIREVSNNFTITPSATDDSTKGFSIDSRWILDNGDVYVCTDATEDNAVWVLQTLDIPTKTSDLINDGDNGTSPFVTADQLPSNLNLFATDTPSDIATYFKLVTSIDDPDFDVTPVNIPTGAITTTGQFIAALATTANVLVGNPGIINLITIGNVRRVSGSGTAEFYYEVYHRTSGGTETLISTSSKTPPISTNVYTEFLAAALLNNGTFLATDRIVVKYYADRIGSGSNPSYEFQFGGTSPVRTNFPVPATNIPLDATPTDGSTNGVQSNGVFDALALKQNVLTNPITGTGANGQVAFFNGTTTQTGDNGLFWDNTNKRLGVGTNAPATRVDIQGTTATDSAALGAELLSSLGWTTVGWTGGFVNGFQHTTGNTNVLSNPLAAVVNTYYQLDITTSGRTAGSVTVAFGGQSVGAGTSNAVVNFGPRATTTGNLTITTTSDFDGTIVISIRTISNYGATVTFKNSSGVVVNEIRNHSINSNTFVGRSAGQRNTTGGSNSFFGRDAGVNNTTGFSNSFFGRDAGFSNTTGFSNSFVGLNAGYNNITGTNNSFVGVNAGFNNTTGGNNSFVGVNAGTNNTAGSSNSFFGRDAGGGNTTGNSNSFVGQAAGFNNTTGNSNSVVGVNAGLNNTTGGSNLFFGRDAGRFISSGGNLTIANNSVFLGVDTRAAADNQTNQIVIGHNAIGAGNNTTVIGNASTTLFRPYGNVAIGADTAGARLDVRAQGALSTDIAFRVRNSADTANLIQVNGAGGIEINSTTQGFLPPRMTSTQKNAIATPVAGLIVYDTTLNKLCVRTASAWETITSI